MQQITRIIKQTWRKDNIVTEVNPNLALPKFNPVTNTPSLRPRLWLRLRFRLGLGLRFKLRFGLGEKAIGHPQKKWRIPRSKPFPKFHPCSLLLLCRNLESSIINTATAIPGTVPNPFCLLRGQTALGTAPTSPIAATATVFAVLNQVLSHIPARVLP